MNRKSSPPSAHDGSPESAERSALEAIVETVIGAAYEVSNVLGAGFLEKVYERALMEEVSLRGLRATAQAPFPAGCWSKLNASNSSPTSIWRNASTT